MGILRKSALVASVAVVGLLGATVAAADETAVWNSAGGNLQNTRFQKSEHKIKVSNVHTLAPKWVFTTAGDVSATPAVDGDRVYFPDWGGYLYAVDRNTGELVWRTSIAAATGIAGDKARNTPAISGNTLVVGAQGPFLGSGRVLAYDKRTGALLWQTIVDTHIAAIITQSATIYNGRVYVGISSVEERLAALVDGYPCCSFRGAMLALDLRTGSILWNTTMVPPGYSGGAVWGSSPAIDPARGQLYIATGNNYSVPQPVLDCVREAGDDPIRRAACLPADDHFDEIMALDLVTGAIRWSTRATPYDAWTVDCLPFIGDGDTCPDPAGPDYDFAQAPALFTVKTPSGQRDLVGAGQKSGQYWAVDPDTGAVVYTTQAGPGGAAGGLQWGSAVDGKRVYTANANSLLVPWTLPDGTVTTESAWSGIDAATGALLWQTVPPHGGYVAGGTSGPATTANGVVFGCSLDPQGYMYALDGATGAVLWEFASGGSCISGAAISDGMVFWGSGYTNSNFGTPNNKLYAFGLP